MQKVICVYRCPSPSPPDRVDRPVAQGKVGGTREFVGGHCLPTTISPDLGAGRNLTAICQDWPANSCSLLMVVTQEATQPVATLYRPVPTSFRNPTEQQDVGLPLMIPLAMVVLDIFAQHPPQRALTKKNDLGQTLLLHRPDPALRIGVQIRTMSR